MSTERDVRNLIGDGREDRAIRLAAKRGLTLRLINPLKEEGQGVFIGRSNEDVFSVPENAWEDGLPCERVMNGQWWLF